MATFVSEYTVLDVYYVKSFKIYTMWAIMLSNISQNPHIKQLTLNPRWQICVGVFTQLHAMTSCLLPRKTTNCMISLYLQILHFTFWGGGKQ